MHIIIYIYIYIFMYIYIYMCVLYIYIYVYVYISRECVCVCVFGQIDMPSVSPMCFGVRHWCMQRRKGQEGPTMVQMGRGFVNAQSCGFQPMPFYAFFAESV